MGSGDAVSNCDRSRSRSAQWRRLRIRSSLMRTVSTISSRNNGVMWNTVHVAGNREASPRRMYKVRIETSPGILIEWNVRAGIHMPK